MRRNATWTVIWSTMLVIALGLGVATRLSHSGSGMDWDGVPYAVDPYDDERVMEFEREGYPVSPSGLEAAAEIVCTVRFTGDRRPTYMATVSTVHVADVLKGDRELADTDIQLYEPIGLSNWNGRRVAAPDAAYRFGGAYMRSGVEYLLFLKRAPARRALPAAYVLVDSPLAKLPLSDEAPILIFPGGGDLPLSACDGYDLVAGDEISRDDYLSRRDEVMEAVL